MHARLPHSLGRRCTHLPPHPLATSGRILLAAPALIIPAVVDGTTELSWAEDGGGGVCGGDDDDVWVVDGEAGCVWWGDGGDGKGEVVCCYGGFAAADYVADESTEGCGVEMGRGG